jgi:hypothetical protein
VLFLLVMARLAGLTGALDRTEARFSSLVHHGGDPIVVLDSQAAVRHASPAWNRLVGEATCPCRRPPTNCCATPTWPCTRVKRTRKARIG